MSEQQRLLSSAEAAALLGVSPASVKRWADAGVLACVKTAGAHRRFRRETLEQFRAVAEPEPPPPSEAATRDAGQWVDALLAGKPAPALEAALLSARSELGSWWRVAERLGPALSELGDRWAAGKITVAEEHLASERLARALSRVGEWLPMRPDAPACLLATAEGDEHTLGLSLVELCLRERGWSPLWIGRSSPIGGLADAVARYDVRLVALSASAHSSNKKALAKQAELVGLACSAYGIPLVVGGSGAWPRQLSYGRLVRDFSTFGQLLSALVGM
jgi:MerR family transcriptional regulator, light-induced transcriptional regulator